MRCKRKVPSSLSAGPDRRKKTANQSRRFQARSRGRRVASVKSDPARKIKPISPQKQRRRHQESRFRPLRRSVQAQDGQVRSRREQQFSRPSPYHFNHHRQSRQQGA
ncbi:hypothetical protein TNCV_3253911 [Trichonephila clavipes]|nr:hypothetical protein TNCV_3253911 [Trichonephila clavipes]